MCRLCTPAQVERSNTPHSDSCSISKVQRYVEINTYKDCCIDGKGYASVYVKCAALTRVTLRLMHLTRAALSSQSLPYTKNESFQRFLVIETHTFSGRESNAPTWSPPDSDRRGGTARRAPHTVLTIRPFPASSSSRRTCAFPARVFIAKLPRPRGQFIVLPIIARLSLSLECPPQRTAPFSSHSSAFMHRPLHCGHDI
jgi:hypothetical protein